MKTPAEGTAGEAVDKAFRRTLRVAVRDAEILLKRCRTAAPTQLAAAAHAAATSTAMLAGLARLLRR